MLPTYPYTSGQAALIKTFAQLRKGRFPAKVDASYLQRFSIAPANESYIISILRFLGLIDEETNRVDENIEFFYGDDDAFKTGLEGALRASYSHLFDEMGDGALEAQRDDLTPWFRAADKTSDLVGQRQASTFKTLAALAGHGELPAMTKAAGEKPKSTASGGTTRKKKTAKFEQKEENAKPKSGASDGIDLDAETVKVQDVGLTVRIEVNLPAGGDSETYDAIFASIKKHLLS